MAWTRAMVALGIWAGLVPTHPGALFAYSGLVVDPSV